MVNVRIMLLNCSTIHIQKFCYLNFMKLEKYKGVILFPNAGRKSSCGKWKLKYTYEHLKRRIDSKIKINSKPYQASSNS